MRKAFSTDWKRSTQARKQRKYRHNAPLHTKSHFLHASLSRDLRERHKRRSLRVRKGDEVELMRGTFKGKKGEVDSVDTERYKLFVRGIEILKRDGSKRPYPVAVSNVRITKLIQDKRRL